MNRPNHNDVDFFLGKEVEHTPAYGLNTLFVVGVQPVQAIEKWLKYYDSCIDGAAVKHIFFGANHSFEPSNNLDWQRWESMIQPFLQQQYLCSLDIPITVVDKFNETSLCNYNNFIPQIRVSIPYIKNWNYNTMIKLDDYDFAASNPGVWTHSLHSLMTRDTFTSWQNYSGDQTL